MEGGRQGVLLHTDLEKAKLSAAFCELALEESFADTEAIRADCDAAHERLLKRLRREYRRIRFGGAAKKTARQAAKAAVFILVTVALAGGIAIASSSLLRAKLFDIVIDYTNSHHRIEINGVEIGEIELPEGWWVPFYHSYVPEGFELDDEYIVSSKCLQVYRSGDQSFFLSYENARNQRTIFYTDGADVEYVTVGDNVVTFIKREGDNNTFFWREGELIIIGHGFMPYDELLKIIEGVVPINIEELSTDK